MLQKPARRIGKWEKFVSFFRVQGKRRKTDNYSVTIDCVWNISQRIKRKSTGGESKKLDLCPYARDEPPVCIQLRETYS